MNFILNPVFSDDITRFFSTKKFVRGLFVYLLVLLLLLFLFWPRESPVSYFKTGIAPSGFHLFFMFQFVSLTLLSLLSVELLKDESLNRTVVEGRLPVSLWFRGKFFADFAVSFLFSLLSLPPAFTLAAALDLDWNLPLMMAFLEIPLVFFYRFSRSLFGLIFMRKNLVGNFVFYGFTAAALVLSFSFPILKVPDAFDLLNPLIPLVFREYLPAFYMVHGVFLLGLLLAFLIFSRAVLSGIFQKNKAGSV